MESRSPHANDKLIRQQFVNQVVISFRHDGNAMLEQLGAGPVGCGFADKLQIWSY
ncbi:hypothetical protein EcE22_3966 [Escherichia coli E22]|nr:hypothetical protein EcE22_3966 [Escherichia coli E22]